MKKNFYKIVALVAIFSILNVNIIGCMSVKSHTEGVLDGAEWIYDHFADAVSAIGGSVYNATDACWQGWKKFMGFENDDGGFEVFNNGHINVGEGGQVTISEDYANDLRRFVKDFNTELDNNTDFRYVYSYDVDKFVNMFGDRARFNAVKDLLYQNRDKKVLVLGHQSGFLAQSTSSNDVGSIAGGGGYAIQICVLNDFSSFVVDTINSSGVSGYCYAYDDNWNRVRWGSSQVTFYGFSSRGDTELSVLDTIPSLASDAVTDNYELGTILLRFTPPENNFNSITNWLSWWSYDMQMCPCYSSVDIMKRYSVGNLPYYQVPQNTSIFTQDSNNNYVTTTSQIDNSISYGDIQSYVNSNNVTDYNVVNNYINNYYTSGGGSGGSGGSGSGGSGSDIDWSWLGKIGEVIGGLISGLGNVIAGIIDGISDLITSITQNLPNIFGSLIAWLLPFLPSEVTALLSATILCIVIVAVIKILRR